MRSGGFWLDRTVDEHLIEAINRTPDKTALVAHRIDRATVQRLTKGSIAQMYHAV